MVVGQMPSANLVSSSITHALSKSWLYGKGYLHAKKLYSFQFINCACLRKLWPSAVNMKNHNRTALHIHHQTIKRKMIFWTPVKVEENFYHSIPAGHRSPRLFKNKAKQFPPPIHWCAAHTSSHKITYDESCNSTCLQQKYETQDYTQGKGAKNNSSAAFHWEM